jgi:hypothetical protein
MAYEKLDFKNFISAYDALTLEQIADQWQCVVNWLIEDASLIDLREASEDYYWCIKTCEEEAMSRKFFRELLEELQEQGFPLYCCYWINYYFQEWRREW